MAQAAPPWEFPQDRRLAEAFFLWVPDTLITGETTEAVDTGARTGVFATTGGSTYLLVTGFVAGGLAALVGWVFVILGAVRRRVAVPAGS